jgi:hypothetical protein
MPRDRIVALALPQRSAFVRQPNALVASAARYDLREKGDKRKPKKIHKEGWQATAWGFYDTIGEYAYACNWVGNLLSKAVLVIYKNGKPVSSGAAVDALKQLFGGQQGQSEMLRSFGIHLSVAGDCYLVGEANGEKPDKWGIVSPQVVLQVGADWKIAGKELPGASTLVRRIWRPHPIDPDAATSPSRAVLPILSELSGMTQGVAATIDSRLVGAGLLFIPNEVSFPSQPVQTDDGDSTAMTRAGVDGFQDALIDAASIAISDQSTPQAKVPLVVQIPGDQIANVKHISFWTDFDRETKDLRQEAIRRIALGMDMPPEALLGTADMNHWNAWQLEEAAIKVHTEPLLHLITSGLTTGYLWPYLEEEMSPEEAQQYTVEADTTELRLRPNRSKEAQEIYNLGGIKIDKMLEENGFSPDDKMGDDELKDWFLRKVASGSTTPELVAEALRQLNVPISAGVNDPTPEETREARPVPSLKEHPEHRPPRIIPTKTDEPANRPALIAAAEVMVFRALERAGNRLKNRGVRAVDVAAADLYQFTRVNEPDLEDLLADAWTCTDRFGYDIPVDRLDAYARSLLLTRAKHDPEVMARYLDPPIQAEAV